MEYNDAKTLVTKLINAYYKAGIHEKEKDFEKLQEAEEIGQEIIDLLCSNTKIRTTRCKHTQNLVPCDSCIRLTESIGRRYCPICGRDLRK